MLIFLQMDDGRAEYVVVEFLGEESVSAVPKVWIGQDDEVK